MFGFPLRRTTAALTLAITCALAGAQSAAAGPPPPGDDYASPIVVSSSHQGSVPFTNVDSVVDPSETDDHGAAVTWNNTTWFSWTAPAGYASLPVNVAFNLCSGVTFSPALAVLPASGGLNAAPLASTAGGCAVPGGGTVKFSAIPGTSYRIVIGSTTPTTGTGTLAWRTAPWPTARLPIIGSPTVGSTLSLDTTIWSGPSVVISGIGWSRCTPDLECTVVPGATASTYVVSDADVGWRIMGYAEADNDLGSSTSGTWPTAVVPAQVAPPAPPAPPLSPEPPPAAAPLNPAFSGPAQAAINALYSSYFSRPATSGLCELTSCNPPTVGQLVSLTQVPASLQPIPGYLAGALGLPANSPSPLFAPLQPGNQVIVNNFAKALACNGGPGDDVCIGGPQADICIATSGSDRCLGAAGKDLCVANTPGTVCAGGLGSDRCIGQNLLGCDGGQGADLCSISIGNGACFGGKGTDVIITADGRGGDKAEGGPGKDLCIVDAKDSRKGCETTLLVKGLSTPAQPAELQAKEQTAVAQALEGAIAKDKSEKAAIEAAAKAASQLGMSGKDQAAATNEAVNDQLDAVTQAATALKEAAAANPGQLDPAKATLLKLQALLPPEQAKDVQKLFDSALAVADAKKQAEQLKAGVAKQVEEFKKLAAEQLAAEAKKSAQELKSPAPGNPTQSEQRAQLEAISKLIKQISSPKSGGDIETPLDKLGAQLQVVPVMQMVVNGFSTQNSAGSALLKQLKLAQEASTKLMFKVPTG